MLFAVWLTEKKQPFHKKKMITEFCTNKHRMKNKKTLWNPLTAHHKHHIVAKFTVNSMWIFPSTYSFFDAVTVVVVIRFMHAYNTLDR